MPITTSYERMRSPRPRYRLFVYWYRADHDRSINAFMISASVCLTRLCFLIRRSLPAYRLRPPLTMSHDSYRDISRYPHLIHGCTLSPRGWSGYASPARFWPLARRLLYLRSCVILAYDDDGRDDAHERRWSRKQGRISTFSPLAWLRYLR